MVVKKFIEQSLAVSSSSIKYTKMYKTEKSRNTRASGKAKKQDKDKQSRRNQPTTKTKMEKTCFMMQHCTHS